MATVVPRLDLGQDGDQAYSPSSAPFALRPAARTPAGRSLLMNTNPLFDQGADSTAAKPAVDEGEQTPRLAGSGKLSDLKGAQGPVSSARKWLAGQARSPVGAALAGSVASPARVAASPVQLPAAAAAHLAADAPTPRLLASAGKLTPRTDTGVAPSPATQFPRSFPVTVGPKAQVAAAPTGGLATWLCMSSHLSKPAEAAAEPASPAGSDASDSSSGSGGARTRTVASLDFNATESKAAGAVDSASTVPAAPAAKPAAAPAAAPATKPAAKPAAPAQPAAAAAPKATQSAAESQPVQASTKRRSAAARAERSSLLALPAVQLVLLCLLGGLLLVAPLAMHALKPTFTQRFMPGRMPDVAAHIRQLSAATSRHASQLSAAAARGAGQLKATVSHHTEQLKAAASQHASQLQAAAVRQAQQARAAAQQAQQAVSQAYQQHLAAAKKAVSATAAPAQSTAKPAAAKPQQQQMKQAQSSSKNTASAAKPQAAAPKPQPASSQQFVKGSAPAKSSAHANRKAASKAAFSTAPATQSKPASVPASSPAPAAAKPQLQPAAKPEPQAPASKLQAASATKPVAQPPAVRAKPVTKPQQAATAGALHSQAAALAAARLAPVWQQLRARLPFLAPPAAAAAAAEPALPGREVQPSALAAAAAAAVAGLAALAALGMRAATSSDTEAAEEEAELNEQPAALPAFPTTTPAVGGRASRSRRQSEAIIAEAEEEGFPSVMAPRQRRASALPTATPGTAPRTNRRKSAAQVNVPASPTSTVTTRRRSMRLAA